VVTCRPCLLNRCSNNIYNCRTVGPLDAKIKGVRSGSNGVGEPLAARRCTLLLLLHRSYRSFLHDVLIYWHGARARCIIIWWKCCVWEIVGGVANETPFYVARCPPPLEIGTRHGRFVFTSNIYVYIVYNIYIEMNLLRFKGIQYPYIYIYKCEQMSI